MAANQELEQYLSQLPGVGPRQAKRIILSLLRREPYFSRRLGDLVHSVRSNMKLCQQTFQYFYSEDPAETLSPIAADPHRDHSQILVVESDSDLEAIEKTELWNGSYFVLGGQLKPSASEASYNDFIRLDELTSIISDRYHKDGDKTEIILGLSSTVNGDFSSEVIKAAIMDISDNINVTHLGRGLSTGTALEYVDKTTLESALNHRTI